MSCKFVEYQIAFYGDHGDGSGPERVYTEDYVDILDHLGKYDTAFWALEGVLPSETFELEEVCRGSFGHCVEIYRRITGFKGLLIEPKRDRHYAIECLSV